MKKILIIYPHWPPSNLAGVHRARLIANYLPDFNWEPTVLTIDEKYYEEKLDYDFCRTVSSKIKVVKVEANPVRKPRIIGDIGIRGFMPLYKKAKELIRLYDYEFLWIPIPSFYTAILGRKLYNETKILYGIDYIDPWVRDIHNRIDFRSVISLKVAKMLEPYAIKYASLISGVSFEYYKPVLERNFPKFLKDRAHRPVAKNPYNGVIFTDIEMPYGFDPNDHKISLDNIIYPWKEDEVPFIYAGAFLPNSRIFMDHFMETLYELKSQGKLDPSFKFYFLGTGSYPGETIEELSKRYNVQDIVIEIKKRFKFLEILNFLSKAEGVMIFGSTEKHYTASKTFQSLMSNTKIFSIFHEESSAIETLRLCNADQFSVHYKENEDWKLSFQKRLIEFMKIENSDWNPNLGVLEKKYSSKMSASILIEGIEKIIGL